MKRILIPLSVLLCANCWAETRYYLLEGAMELPNGRQVGTSLSLVKRTEDRAAGKIEEVVLNIRGKDPALETTTVIRVEGDKATLSSPDGGFSGEGKLRGPEWAWTQMTFTAKLEQGMTIEGEDEFAPESMTATKRVLGADGKLQIVIRESGRTIDEALYDLLRSRLKAK